MGGGGSRRQRGSGSPGRRREPPGDAAAAEDVFLPDPPCDAEDDEFGAIMGGWSMHGRSHDTDDEDEEVTEQIKAMLNRMPPLPDDYDVEDNRLHPLSVSYSPPRDSPSSSKVRIMSTSCMFFLGFLLGTIIVVGASFMVDKTPSQELREMELHAHLRSHPGKGGNETDTGKEASGGLLVWDPTQGDAVDVPAGQEEEEDLSEFCERCQWKHMPFNCKERVQWEMEQYGMTEEEAKRSNLKHCLPPPSTPEAAVGGP